MSGGKRIRPILAQAALETLDGNSKDYLAQICALELIHTYSLIHDDLPAMDNDDFRRGNPTTHKAFDEATAILAGDALLTKAFQLIVSDDDYYLDPKIAVKIINEISNAIGSKGMIGGQMLDIESQGKEIEPSLLLYIHTNKTGALITASVRIGGILGGATGKELNCLTSYGKEVGLAFQIRDDLLDIEGEENLLGKKTGSDLKKKKATHPLYFGVEKSKKSITEIIERAIWALKPFNEKAKYLVDIANFIKERNI
jgi:geranylgeranyl diphosphate synthase type II